MESNAGRAIRTMRLIEHGEGEPAIVHRLGSRAPFLVVCDHAGRAVPRALGDMGVPPAGWERHIAWDIGGAALADSLGEAWGAAVIKQRWSRLVIDCNRAPSRPDAIPEVSDGQPVPANVGLSAEARAARVAEVHAPYHAAIAAELDARAAAGTPTLLVLVHSFTPRMAGFDRPWTFGVLHAGDSPVSHAALELLRREPGEVVGDNEPYAMDLIDYTAPTHATARGLDYLELEVRQDLIADHAGVARVSEILARVVPAAAELAASRQPAPTASR